AHAPEALYHKENPLKPTQENLLAGKSLYQTDAHPTACKICHGVFGNGLGMMAVGQNPAPRNFLCSKTMKDIPDGQMFWIIKKGSPGTKMPAYKNLSDRQVWQIVLYLRQLAHEAEVRRNR
ncbi:MAG: c-type cytochrome, partial [Nitrospinaceae bacterium]|nr:cytochrome c [Nitrospinaceae bacterium]NIR53818.1 cytochrome c [Nitrospinaceae bacterium]NIS84229.1 cytochrome c [Nitrospinaceae bacterium]NIT81033.1 cytochrome c [Nitrospinaceae bacterium]NIU43324.1 cytochrome c [Nitrospinaceae bacterium]